MAVLVGKSADIYLATGTGTSMTGEAVTDLTGGIYQITDAAKRAINPNAALTVLDGVATVPPANYQISWASGKIRLTNGYSAVGTITVTGQYLTLAQAAQGFEWSLDVTPVLEDTQTFGDSWKERTVVQRDASVTFAQFYNDGYFHANLNSYYVLALYINVAGADRYLLGAQMTTAGITAGENETIKQNVSFAIHGGLDLATS